MTTDRQVGFGSVGPITFTAIDRYGTRVGIVDPDVFERFSLLLRAMDGEYLKHVRATAPKDRASRTRPEQS